MKCKQLTLEVGELLVFLEDLLSLGLQPLLESANHDHCCRESLAVLHSHLPEVLQHLLFLEQLNRGGVDRVDDAPVGVSV